MAGIVGDIRVIEVMGTEAGSAGFLEIRLWTGCRSSGLERMGGIGVVGGKPRIVPWV